VDRLVTAGLLNRYEIPHVGKRYKRSEVLAVKEGQTKPEQRSEQRAEGKTAAKAEDITTHEEHIFACPGTDPFVAAKWFNDLWASGGIDATFRNTRKPGEPALEWPMLVASPYFGPEGEGKPTVLVRWDNRSGLTHELVVAMFTQDKKTALDELRRLFPAAAKASDEGVLPGLPSGKPLAKSRNR
jgi:hypothetical protein